MTPHARSALSILIIVMIGLAHLGCDSSNCDSYPPMPEVLVMIHDAAADTGCEDSLVMAEADSTAIEVVCRVDVWNDADCSCNVYSGAEGEHTIHLMEDGQIADTTTVEVELALCGADTVQVDFDWAPGGTPGAGGGAP